MNYLQVMDVGRVNLVDHQMGYLEAPMFSPTMLLRQIRSVLLSLVLQTLHWSLTIPTPRAFRLSTQFRHFGSLVSVDESAAEFQLLTAGPIWSTA